ncbi:LemA protein [Prevotella communis]|uniref:LemA protein n=1 Tax=Prevotella communis TaxID=2913614 RepID=A0A1G8C3H7_9BACT|nr:LemA family protein [Prevotella communis]UKK60622.1 LemA family protein [Prevotella communis]UKK63433.1 LemA family protein [Prevotella communis]UKK66259.1 LemA family protein [Prevotella communis]SDH39520.1 LemA protein [Prevotella communis]
MKKSYVVLIVVAVIAVIAIALFGWVKSTYNGMVSVEEEATTALANVQSAYQRRADLIPNLVQTVKGYASHEKETLEGVVNARSKATSITLNAENIKEYQQAQGELSSALGRLIAIGEAYPDLKANENFRELQVQLEGTENRINVERNNFNKAVQTYNVAIRKFPSNLLAGIFGFEKMDKFEAAAGSENAPKVEF